MGNPNRVNKTHNAIAGYDPAGGLGGYTFDTLSMIWFPAVGAAGAGSTLATVRSVLGIPQRCEIVKVIAYVPTANLEGAGAGAITGANTLSIQVGTGAAGSASGAGWTVQATGNVVFATAPAGPTALDTPVSFAPDVPTAWYDTGAYLTVRVTTVVTTGVLTGLKVGLLVCIVDAKPGVLDSANPATPDF